MFLNSLMMQDTFCYFKKADLWYTLHRSKHACTLLIRIGLAQAHPKYEDWRCTMKILCS